jgi:hypothetical protein
MPIRTGAALSASAKGAAQLVSLAKENLTPDDDPLLWTAASGVLIQEFLDGPLKATDNFLQIGRCSHWLRPHQTRWTAAGGFAWPSGYGGSSAHGRNGLPEFDWSITLRFERDTWGPADHPNGKRPTVLRVAIPARTAKHNQAVMDLRWQPAKTSIFLGWRKDAAGNWLVAAEEEWNVEAT